MTLFGKGFGELIQSRFKIACPHWAQVPKKKFYLAVCVSDLQQIIEMEGDEAASPMRVCHGISWFSPSAAFDVCPCTKTHSQTHSDLVQILWPTFSTKLLPKPNKVQLHQEGAVIFGYNKKIKWKFDDTEDPTEGDPSLEQIESTTENLENDTSGLTESSSSRQRDQTTSESSATTDASVQQSQISETSSKEIATKLNETETVDHHQDTTHTEMNNKKNPSEPSKLSSDRTSLFHKI